MLTLIYFTKMLLYYRKIIVESRAVTRCQAIVFIILTSLIMIECFIVTEASFWVWTYKLNDIYFKNSLREFKKYKCDKTFKNVAIIAKWPVHISYLVNSLWMIYIMRLFAKI